MKLSAGILLYRHDAATGGWQLMLVHPGGPFWARKDDGAWSAPKGEIEDGEDLKAAARREFLEETGMALFPKGRLISLGKAKVSSSKTVHLWAVGSGFDVDALKSNEFEMVWPPRSGTMQRFPEVDRAAWFGPEEALVKIHAGQAVFVRRLAKKLGYQLAMMEPEPSVLASREGRRPRKVTIRLEQTRLF